MRLTRLCPVTAIALIISCGTVRAQTAPVGARATDAQPGVSFTDSQWSLTLMGYAALDVSGQGVGMAGPTVGLSYYLTDNFAGMLELTGWRVWQDDDTYAGALNLLLRHHMFELGKATVFADFGGGIFRAGERVPEDGTHFNSTIQAGFGITYPIADDVYFVGGIRYYHLSNARRRGGDRNPSLNGPSIFLGIEFTF
jgi:hypothetical protein